MVLSSPWKSRSLTKLRQRWRWRGVRCPQPKAQIREHTCALRDGRGINPRNRRASGRVRRDVLKGPDRQRGWTEVIANHAAICDVPYYESASRPSLPSRYRPNEHSISISQDVLIFLKTNASVYGRLFCESFSHNCNWAKGALPRRCVLAATDFIALRTRSTQISSIAAARLLCLRANCRIRPGQVTISQPTPCLEQSSAWPRLHRF